jgi:UDP-N-acetylglucosamine diphosphorylase/glucosamine-1-phosphate N-acetyltransferase
VILIDASVLVDDSMVKMLSKSNRNLVITSKDLVIAASATWKSIAKITAGPYPLQGSTISRALRERGEVLEHESAKIIRDLWDLISVNEDVLADDVKPRRRGTRGASKAVTVRGDPNSLVLDNSVDLEPGVILDVRRGGIRLGQGCKIMAPTRIDGPCWISRGTQIFPGSYISKSTIGVECRVGGEISNSIIEDYSNKRHSGYLGDSYVARWANLAAGTQTSNLKTTYGTVKMSQNGRRVDTGKMFLGSFIGEQVKTGIGTQIFAGRRVGVFSHVIGYVTDDVPPFTFWGKSLGSEPVELELSSALATQHLVAARRGIRLTRQEKELTEVLFRMSVEERRISKVRKGRIRF